MKRCKDCKWEMKPDDDKICYWCRKSIIIADDMKIDKNIKLPYYKRKWWKFWKEK